MNGRPNPGPPQLGTASCPPQLRRVASSQHLPPPRFLLWLAYLLGDSTAIYTLGHIANSKSPELQLAAFWAPFLLLHLGGQDTITAYALQDNQLWLRHLLTLVLQALGAAYVLYRHIAGTGTLVTAGVLIFLVGTLRYGERVWTLKSSSPDGISNFLDNVEMSENEQRNDPVQVQERNAEDVLQEAHDLLYICMGQFVDYKVWPSRYQQVVKQLSCDNEGRLFELIGMQLSIMHDIFYTKAAVIHTWYGCCIRALSLLTTFIAFFLFKFKVGKDGYTRVDVAVTYTLLIGTMALEMTSILRAIGSSWTCSFLRTRRWDRLHRTVMLFRRLFKSAERGRGWSGSVGQHDLSLILGVWVEMLCYAASHSSRDSHARQLNSGAEFITVVWILATSVFNSFYCEHAWFQDAAGDFFRARSTQPND